jgi:RNA-directed DNA polymerase
MSSYFSSPNGGQLLVAGRAFYERQRKRAAFLDELSITPTPTVEQIAGFRHLQSVFDDLKREGGRAPGPDGLTYRDLSRRESAHMLRELSETLMDGTYRPQPGRIVKIPKSNGKVRTLTLSRIADRVVSTALNRRMTPFWEPMFLPGSMGFRPGRGPLRLLAELKTRMEQTKRWVLAVDDVSNAFPSVVIDKVMEDHRQHINDKALLTLVELILHGGKNETVGISQGDGYSPTALNVHLHCRLDSTYDSDTPPWFRYVDNLVYLCRDVTEGHQALNHARKALDTVGMSLKGEDGVRNLKAGETVNLMGFIFSEKDGELIFSLGDQAWSQLTDHLMQAHEKDNPPESAKAGIKGWLNYFCGPAFENRRDNVLDRVQETSAQLGFDQLHLVEVEHWVKAAEEQWRGLCKEAAHLYSEAKVD